MELITALLRDHGADVRLAARPDDPLELLARAKRELQVPVAAIGGITLHNAAQAIAAGADLLAVISDVFDDPDPGARPGALAWSL